MVIASIWSIGNRNEYVSSSLQFRINLRSVINLRKVMTTTTNTTKKLDVGVSLFTARKDVLLLECGNS